MFADWVEQMSGGQLQIKVYGGGELIPALEAFDAVSSGTAEIGSGAAYYWAGKTQASQIFGALPFGMNPLQMQSWLYAGDGMKHWEKLYAEFNLIPFPAGNTGVQMGGWFNRVIQSIDDLKGLKMRIPGLGGKVLNKAGGTAVLVAGGEIYTNLERGVIDATEWIGPYHDYLMGFHRIARNYYYPGWHEPGAVLELFVNKYKFEQLPLHLQEIIRTTAYRLNLWVLSEFESKNAEYLEKIRSESKVAIKRFPDEVLHHLRQFRQEVLEELRSSSPDTKAILDSYFDFKKKHRPWADISGKEYYNAIM
jgi:TRAP-type mannitol/chloroaromatic compound transport system substrate-binding protein